MNRRKFIKNSILLIASSSAFGMIARYYKKFSYPIINVSSVLGNKILESIKANFVNLNQLREESLFNSDVELKNKIALDYRENKTITVDFWIYSETEALTALRREIKITKDD